MKRLKSLSEKAKNKNSNKLHIIHKYLIHDKMIE